jgi:hypothetical protein
MMTNVSGQSGSLWVTVHKSRKLNGAESVMSVCNQKCAFKSFCYSEHLQAFQKYSRNRAELNCVALKQSPSTFVEPKFNSEIVRWFSMGSCNGDRNTLLNVMTSIHMNQQSKHAIWVEPHYWLMANELLNPTEVNIIYSNKELDSIKQIEGRVTFNLASSHDKCNSLLKENHNAIRCNRQCNVCGWYCYKQPEGIVVEIVNTKHGGVDNYGKV